MLSALFLQALTDTDVISHKPYPLWAGKSQLSQLFLKGQMHCFPPSPLWSSAELSLAVPYLFCIKSAELDLPRNALTTILWTKLFRQFSVYLAVCSSSLYFLSLTTTILWKMMVGRSFTEEERQYPLLSPLSIRPVISS